MKSKIKEVLILAVALLLVWFLLKGLSKEIKYDNTKIKVDTVKIVVYDTIPYYKPVPKDSAIVRYITVKLPIADSSLNKDSIPEATPDSIPEATPDSIPEVIPDSINIEIPITQKIYKDSAYTAYVSGYNPQLDSLFLFPYREITTIMHKPKQKRWNIGIQAGFGLILKNTPELRPYIGIGGQYNFFSF